LDARTAIKLLAAGRVLIGGAYVAAPGRAMPAWVGAVGSRPSTHVLGAAFGSRDAAVGLGTLAALRSGRGVRPWILAGVAGDAADLAATLKARDHLPGQAVAGVVLMAGSALVVAGWGLAELG
jgi:hypothetical protein